ncbi:MAG: HEPN domain-containing protein [Bacteroidales bacterium]
MNNNDVQKLLDDCDSELTHINSFIATLGPGNLIVPYMNKYAVIKSCGTIEISFKTLIADFCNRRSKIQIKAFINKKVRESSANPTLERIIQMLKEFDETWGDSLRTQLQTLPNYLSIQTSIKSLVDARNDFAHGGNPSIAFNDVRTYFTESKNIIVTLDQIIG